MAEPTDQDIRVLLSQPGFTRLARWMAVLIDHSSGTNDQSQGGQNVPMNQGWNDAIHQVNAISRRFDAISVRGDSPAEKQNEEDLLTSWTMLRKVVYHVERMDHQYHSNCVPSSTPTQMSEYTSRVQIHSRHMSDGHQPCWSPDVARHPPPQNFIGSSPTSGLPSTYGYPQQYRPSYLDTQQQQLPWNDQHPALTHGSSLNYSYAPSTPQNNAAPRLYTHRGSSTAPNPRGIFHQGRLLGDLNEPMRDPALGVVPHIYQTSALAPMVVRPGMSSRPLPNTSSSRNTPVEQGAARKLSSASVPRIDGSGNHKALYDTFKQASKPKRFFRVGRVFMILWTEPLGDESLSESSQFTLQGLYGDWLHQKVRRFIVIGEAERHCLALPILSYGNKGVSKQGLNKADHGIVYIGPKAPEPDDDERPARNELPMVEIPIRVDPDNPTEKLGQKSRIHYSKVCTIEHNVKAKSVGMIHARSLPDLLYQTKLVWSRTPNGLGRLGIEPGRTLEPSREEEIFGNSNTSTDLTNPEPAIEYKEQGIPSQPGISVGTGALDNL